MIYSCAGFPHQDCIIDECQECGEEIRHRSKYNVRKSERDDRAWNPYNYVMFCRDCVSKGYHIENI